MATPVGQSISVQRRADGRVWTADRGGVSIPGSTTMQSSVTQYGITWTFSQPRPVGQFVNGDFYVIGPVTITSMSPDWTGSRNGWAVNPTNTGGVDRSFDSRIDGFSAPRSLPYSALPGQSIVKAISNAAPASGNFNFLDTVAVLTVLAEVPPATAFRPPYAGSNKPIYDSAALRMDILPNLAPVSAPPTFEQVRQRFAMPQFDINPGNFRIRQYISDRNFTSFAGGTSEYGAQIGVDWATGVLALFLSGTQEQKRPAVIACVQAGIDYYHNAVDVRRYQAEAGLFQGRKLPAVFAATMLNNASMISGISSRSGRNTGSGANDLHQFNTWQEDDQIYYSPDANGGAGMVLWGERTVFGTTAAYVANIGAGSASGANTIADPYDGGHIDGGVAVSTSGNYQWCCSTGSYIGMALALVLSPEMRAVWNNDDFITYVDRWMNHGVWLAPDPYSGTSARRGINTESFHGSFRGDVGFYSSGLANAMWAAYR